MPPVAGAARLGVNRGRHSGPYRADAAGKATVGRWAAGSHALLSLRGETLRRLRTITIHHLSPHPPCISLHFPVAFHINIPVKIIVYSAGSLRESGRLGRLIDT